MQASSYASITAPLTFSSQGRNGQPENRCYPVDAFPRCHDGECELDKMAVCILDREVTPVPWVTMIETLAARPAASKFNEGLQRCSGMWKRQ